MRLLTLALLTILAFPAAAPASLAANCAASGTSLPVSSRFDAEVECWTAEEDGATVPVTWNAGRLQATASGVALLSFRAPDAYLGDRSDAYGGELWFRGLYATANSATVVLESSVGDLRREVGLPGALGFNVSLFQNGWTIDGNSVDEATFRDALSMVNGLRIETSAIPAPNGFQFLIDDVYMLPPGETQFRYVADGPITLDDPFTLTVYVNAASDLFGASFTIASAPAGGTAGILDFTSLEAPPTDCTGDGIPDPTIFTATPRPGPGSAYDVAFSLRGDLCTTGISDLGVPIAIITAVGRTEGVVTVDVRRVGAGGVKSDGTPTQISSAISSVYPVRNLATVWPGDADDSGVVDAQDLLPIGARYDVTGPARDPAEQDIVWEAKLAAFWAESSDTFIDANGDGRIDAADVLAVGLNFGLTHAAPTHADGSAPLAQIQIAPQPVGTEIPVTVGADADGLLGAAVLLGVPDGLSIVSAGPSPRLDDGDVLDLWNGVATGVDAAATRKAGADLLDGPGDLLTVTLRVDTPMDGPAEVTLDRLTLGTPDGSAPASAETVTLSSPFIVAGERAPTAALGITSVAPNPAAGRATVRFASPAGPARVAVYDALGRQVAVLLDGAVADGAHAVEIDTARLAPGLYVVRVTAGGAHDARALTVLR